MAAKVEAFGRETRACAPHRAGASELRRGRVAYTQYVAHSVQKAARLPPSNGSERDTPRQVWLP